MKQKSEKNNLNIDAFGIFHNLLQSFLKCQSSLELLEKQAGNFHDLDPPTALRASHSCMLGTVQTFSSSSSTKVQSVLEDALYVPFFTAGDPSGEKLLLEILSSTPAMLSGGGTVFTESHTAKKEEKSLDKH